MSITTFRLAREAEEARQGVGAEVKSSEEAKPVEEKASETSTASMKPKPKTATKAGS